MIAYDPKIWFKFIFKIHKSDSFRALIPALIALIMLTTLLVFIEVNYLKIQVKNLSFFHQVIGFVLSMLLVFRINTAYDRWWEGRKAWGELLNVSRTLSCLLDVTLTENANSIRSFYSDKLADFAFQLKNHLRENSFKQDDINSSSIIHLPLFVTQELYKKTNELFKQNLITSENYLLINNQLNRLNEITGTCERIKSTPIPYSYSLYLKRIIFLYVITMPFVFAIDFKYWAVMFVTLIFYTFASLELLSEEIEDPFGTDANDLPTDEIAEKIKNNIQTILLKTSIN
jgi:putative membrane protein